LGAAFFFGAAFFAGFFFAMTLPFRTTQPGRGPHTGSRAGPEDASVRSAREADFTGPAGREANKNPAERT
jgi:hypothetical protein